MYVPLHGIETMICGEKERSRIRVVQMDNLRGLLCIRSMNRVPNELIRKLWGVVNGWRMIGLLKRCMWESVCVEEVD